MKFLRIRTRIIEKKRFLLLLILILFCFCYCEKLIDPIPKPPIAIIKSNKFSRIGSYIILDGSNSIPGRGEQIIWYEWKEDVNNPSEVYLYSGENNYIQTVGFTKEGIYKFSLVVSDGIDSSRPSEIEINVSPREYTIFYDPALEVHIRYALKIPESVITNNILLELDSLNCSRIAVSDINYLDGIENCSELEYLNLAHQNITDISPLHTLLRLKYLNLSQNRSIVDISPLANLTQLKYLDLDSNEILEITPLSNLIQIEYLNLQFNQNLSNISIINNLKNLRELWLANSPITNIDPVSGLDQLYLLWIAGCNLTDITPVENLTNLRLLFLKYNNITDISPINDLINLEKLYLDYNNIMNIDPLEGLSQINFIGLSHNNISNILPLLNNTGLDSGDVVGLGSNPLNENSINNLIPELKARGIIVLWP